MWVDDNGTPRPLVGVSYEEFAKAWRVYQGLEQAERGPRYTLQSLTTTGQIGGEQKSAVTKLNIRLRVETHDEGLVAVPIRFSNAIFTGQLQGLQPKREHLAYDASQGGYVLWLEGGGGEPREVQIQLLTRVYQSADGIRIRLNMPRANQSRLELLTSAQVVSPTVSDPALITTEATDDERTRLVVQGAVGLTRIDFRTPAKKAISKQAVLSAQGKLQLRIDDRSVRSTANLTVEGLGHPFDRFLVRLPAGATLLEAPEQRADGVRIVPIDRPLREEIANPSIADPDKNASDRPDESAPGQSRLLQQRVVEVSRSERSLDPLTVELVAERPLGSAPVTEASPEAIDLAGFSVIGAVFQTGWVAISATEGVQLEWESRDQWRGAARIKPSDLPEDLARRGPPIAVRYHRPDWQWKVRIGREQREIRATPFYRLEILPAEARLTLATQFRMSGGSVFEFAFDRNGWETATADPTGPEGLIDAEHVHESGGHWVVPLARAADRRTDVQVQFRRPLVGGKRFDWRLPLPVANSFGVGQLVVVAHPSVELDIDPDQLRGLEPSAVAANSETADDPALLRTRVYRLATVGDEPARFVAERRRRPGRLEVASTSSVVLSDHTTEISQTFRYDARYQPIDRVMFLAPEGWKLDELPMFELSAATSQDVRSEELTDVVELIAKPVEQSQLPAELGSGNEASSTLSAWVLPLPGPRLGSFQLDTHYSLDVAEASQPNLKLPLLQPLIWQTRGDWRSIVDVTAPEGLGARLAEDLTGWEASPNDTVTPKLRVTSAANAPPLQITLAPLPNEPAPSAEVQQVWFQTWENASQRQTRVAYRVTSDSGRLEILVPTGLSGEEIEYAIDGQPLRPQVINQQRVALIDDSLADGEPHTVTMRLLAPREVIGVTPLLAPRVVADSRWAVCYWEVVQPADWQVVNTPIGMAGAYDWRWGPFGWGRHPKLTTEQLAEQTGGEPGPPLAAGEHRYLFVGRGEPPGGAELRSLRRSTSVLLASGLTLAVGFLLSRLNLLRYSSTYYVLLVMLGAICLIAPYGCLMFVQLGALGLVLAAVTLFVERRIRAAAHETQFVLTDSRSFAEQGALVLPTDSLTSDSVSTNAPTVSVGHGDAAEEK